MSDSVLLTEIMALREANQELLEMLELTRQMRIKRQFPSENELKEMASEIEELIKKHHNERV